MSRAVLASIAVLLTVSSICPEMTAAADRLSAEAGQRALKKAVDFFRQKVSDDGAYLWNYSSDLKLREGEGRASETMGWVQPPGTPYVGEALLEAYLVAGEDYLLDAAREAAHALARGQLMSGGWDYVLESAPKKRTRWAFRVDVEKSGSKPSSKAKNTTTLDDDTTQAALRFLMKTDAVLKQKDRAIHSAVEYALAALLKAQYPNGAWPQRYFEFPDAKQFPIKKASYPDSFSRTHPKLDYRSYYTFNDNTLADLIDTMFLAESIYGEKKYGDAARRAGDFILLAQMPEPQPAWAQQYNAEMQPAWARRFEPAAVTGGESQGVIRILLTLYKRTGDRKYLEPIPRALDYLEKSQLPDGRLARFYELKTNRPLYFTTDYVLTYDDGDLPTHYGFKVSSNIAGLRKDFEKTRREKSDRSPLWTTTRSPPKPYDSLTDTAAKLVKSMDSRGAWLESGKLRTDDSGKSSEKIITTKTFSRNLRTLARFVGSMKRR